MTEKNDIIANGLQEAVLFQDACTIIEQAKESVPMTLQRIYNEEFTKDISP